MEWNTSHLFIRLLPVETKAGHQTLYVRHGIEVVSVFFKVDPQTVLHVIANKPPQCLLCAFGIFIKTVVLFDRGKLRDEIQSHVSSPPR